MNDKNHLLTEALAKNEAFSCVAVLLENSPFGNLPVVSSDHIRNIERFVAYTLLKHFDGYIVVEPKHYAHLKGDRLETIVPLEWKENVNVGSYSVE